MAGLEPASERIDPRISTSVVAYWYSPITPQAAKMVIWLATGTRKPLFRPVSSIPNGTPTF